MQFAPDVRGGLNEVELEALSNAVDLVDDYLLGEMASRYSELPGSTTERMFSSMFLPPRFSDVYDFRLLRRSYACLLVLAERLQNGWQQPRCRAEELVLRAVLDQAEVCFEDLGGGETESFADLRERLFEDLDLEFMFHPRFDGVDDPDTYEGSQLGTGLLHPSSWFEPFRDDEPVHPMAR